MTAAICPAWPPLPTVTNRLHSTAAPETSSVARMRTAYEPAAAALLESRAERPASSDSESGFWPEPLSTISSTDTGRRKAAVQSISAPDAVRTAFAGQARAGTGWFSGVTVTVALQVEVLCRESTAVNVTVVLWPGGNSQPASLVKDGASTRSLGLAWAKNALSAVMVGSSESH